MAPSKLPGICGKNEHVETALPGSRQEADGQLVVVGHVKLIEARAGAIRSPDVFDGLRSRRGETVGDVELSRNFRDGQFAFGVIYLIYADGRNAEGCSDVVSEDRGSCRSPICVYQLARDDLVSIECLAIV